MLLFQVVPLLHWHLAVQHSYYKSRSKPAFIVTVRPGGIGPPTNPWQGLVIPLNHGRGYKWSRDYTGFQAIEQRTVTHSFELAIHREKYYYRLRNYLWL